MKCASPAGVLAAVTAWVAWSQPPARPEFDVASLKPVVLDGADTYTANLGSYRNGVLTQTNTTLAECIRFAYEITSDDLLSGPDWIKNKNVRFDILAKTAPATPRGEALLMLRTLLDERDKEKERPLRHPGQARPRHAARRGAPHAADPAGRSVQADPSARTASVFLLCADGAERRAQDEARSEERRVGKESRSQ